MDNLIGRTQERKELFAEITGVSRGLVFTFITPTGLSQGTHSRLVHSELTAEDLFAVVKER
jgi:hypothetical protein